MKKSSFDNIEPGLEKYHAIRDNSIIGYFLAKPDGTLLDANNAACELFGYTEQEFKELNHHDYIDCDDKTLENIFSNRRKKGSLKTEITGIKKNGERFPLEIFSVIFTNADGEERACTLVSDISERKKTEKALIRSQQQFNALVNTVDGIVWEADAQTFAFSFVSKQAELLLGYPIQQWMEEATFWEDHIHPDDRSWAVTFCEKNIHEKKAHKFEYRMIAADGRAVWLQDIVSVIIENDQPAYITGLMIDITDRKNAEMQMIDSERRYRSLFEQNLSGVYRTSLKGMILACNNAFAGMLGYDAADELLYTDAANLYFSPADRSAFIENLRKQKKIYGYETVLKRRDGDPLFILENISLFTDPVSGDEICDGVMIDITERKKTAAALQKSYEEVVANETLMESAEKMAHFGSWSADFVNGICKWSDEFFRMYGYEPGTVEPSLDLFIKHVYPEDLAYINEKVSGSFSNPPAQKLNFRIIDRNGVMKHVNAETQVEYNGNGEAIWMTGFNIDVTEKTGLEEKIIEEKIKKRQEITAAVITAQEQERKFLGEELHDNINQVLATARLYIESAIADKKLRKDLMTESKDYIISAMNEIRDLSRSLMPPSLGVVSLTEAIKDLFDNINRANRLVCITEWNDLDERLISEKLKLTVFRIVQEQLNNIITHAKANTVTVRLNIQNNCLQLHIKDDGIGFDTTKKRMGVGLQNITSRSELFGGNVIINSTPGTGCELVIDFGL